MHWLQELVRLHRVGEGAREVARQLRMSPNTEREYRQVFAAAGLLEGDPESIPDVAVLRELVTAKRVDDELPQQQSSIEPWRARIEFLMRDGASPTAIFDRLRTDDKEFTGSLSAVKRLYERVRKAQGVRPQDVAILVGTLPGKIAQVDFGSEAWRQDVALGEVAVADQPEVDVPPLQATCELVRLLLMFAKWIRR